MWRPDQFWAPRWWRQKLQLSPFALIKIVLLFCLLPSPSHIYLCFWFCSTLPFKSSTCFHLSWAKSTCAPLNEMVFKNDHDNGNCAIVWLPRRSATLSAEGAENTVDLRVQGKTVLREMAPLPQQQPPPKKKKRKFTASLFFEGFFLLFTSCSKINYENIPFTRPNCLHLDKRAPTSVEFFALFSKCSFWSKLRGGTKRFLFRVCVGVKLVIFGCPLWAFSWPEPPNSIKIVFARFRNIKAKTKMAHVWRLGSGSSYWLGFGSNQMSSYRLFSLHVLLFLVRFLLGGSWLLLSGLLFHVCLGSGWLGESECICPPKHGKQKTNEKTWSLLTPCYVSAVFGFLPISSGTMSSSLLCFLGCWVDICLGLWGAWEHQATSPQIYQRL